jgi:hypothetical protein
MKTIKRYGKVAVGGLLILILIGGLINALYNMPQVFAAPVDSYHSSWHLVRETANEDGATFAAVYALAGIESNFANMDSTGVLSGGAFRIPAFNPAGPHEGWSAGQTWELMFCGENRNNVDDTFSFNVIGWNKLNGPLQVIAEGDGVLGTQSVVVFPDGGDALGPLVSLTGVTYDHTGGAQETYFSKANVGLNVVAGMQAYVTGTNITSGFYQVTVVTDDDNIKIAVTATDDNTDSTVQIAPSMWADTITLDETTKWPKFQGDLPGVGVYNSGDNEIAILQIQNPPEYMQVVVYDADGATGEEAGNITVYGRRK